jgi:DNA-directed RNA polymerase specialized sigma24 family protein
MADLERIRRRHFNDNPYDDVIRKYTAREINNMTNDEFYFNYLDSGIRRMREKAVRNIIDDLPNEYKKVIKAWYYQDLREEKIADKFEMELSEVEKAVDMYQEKLDMDLGKYILRYLKSGVA